MSLPLQIRCIRQKILIWQMDPNTEKVFYWLIACHVRSLHSRQKWIRDNIRFLWDSGAWSPPPWLMLASRLAKLSGQVWACQCWLTEGSGPLDLVYDAKKDMNIHVAPWAARPRPRDVTRSVRIAVSEGLVLGVNIFWQARRVELT